MNQDLKYDLSHILWIGGSPCSGKSSIARQLAQRHGLPLYSCDEHFDAHKELIDPQRQPTFHALIQMTWNQVWDRTPEQLLQSEEAIYREEFEFILDDLLAHDRSLPLIAEGTALMPDLVAPLLADRSQGIWIVPTEAFQRQHYRQRGPWVDQILNQCDNPDQAYENWMGRDAAFARNVEARAAALRLEVLRVDGRRSIEENASHSDKFLSIF